MPTGATDGGLTLSRRRRGFEPSAATLLSATVEPVPAPAKAIRCPSGDHAGGRDASQSIGEFSGETMTRAPDPSAAMVTSRVVPMIRSPRT